MLDFLNTARAATNIVNMPSTYRKMGGWVPKLGDLFPNFSADTTHGHIDFHEWAEGSWILLVGCPRTMGAVSATELAGISSIMPDLKRRRVKPICLTECTLGGAQDWVAQIEEAMQTEIRLPIIADHDVSLSMTFGFHHERDAEDNRQRRMMILDPALKVRAVLDYPVFLGRSTEEMLRVIDALQLRAITQLGTPADWQPGDPGLVAPYLSDEEARQAYPGGFTDLGANLRVVDTRNAG